jgi:mono/diheme cytochrome c family protein
MLARVQWLKSAAAALVLVLTPLSLARPAARCSEPAGDWKAGRAVYHRTCVSCHGEDGQGLRAGVPDFRAGVMAYSTDSLLTHIKNGFHPPGRPLQMPPKGGNPQLTNEDIRNVLTYLRHRFGCG